MRFAHGLQVKTETFHTKVIHGKVVEEIELIYVHCSTTWEIQIKFIKIKDNLSQTCQNKFPSKPLYFLNKFKVFECHWLVFPPKVASTVKIQILLHQNQLRRTPRDHWQCACAKLSQNFQITKTAITPRLLVAVTCNFAQKVAHNRHAPSCKISAPLPPVVHKLSPKRYIFNSFQDPCQDSFQDPGLDHFKTPIICKIQHYSYIYEMKVPFKTLLGAIVIVTFVSKCKVWSFQDPRFSPFPGPWQVDSFIFQPPKFDWHTEDQQLAFDEWKGQITLALHASSINQDIWFAMIIGYLGKEGFKRWNTLPISTDFGGSERSGPKFSRLLRTPLKSRPVILEPYRWDLLATSNKVTMSQLTSFTRGSRIS